MLVFLGGVVVRLLILGATRELHYESTTRRTIRRWPSISYQAQGSATRAASSRHVPLCIRRRWRSCATRRGTPTPGDPGRTNRALCSDVRARVSTRPNRVRRDHRDPWRLRFSAAMGRPGRSMARAAATPVSRRGVLRLGFPVTEANLRNNLSTSGERPLKMAAPFPSRATASALLSLRSSSAPPATSSLGLVLPHPNGRGADVPADFNAHSRSHDRVTSGAVERAQ